MKTPPRSFVVEFKSGRRQPAARTNSIWGDTDLKALAREVQQKAPHLFTAHEAPGTSDSGEAPRSDPINGSAGETADPVEIARAATPSTGSAGLETPKRSEADRLAAKAVAHVQKSDTVLKTRPAPPSTARERVKRAPAQTIARNSTGEHQDLKARTEAADNPISLDELAALDADNKRLKRLLADQLRAQNLRLMKMLERFDAE
ncbi:MULTISPECIES: hypothetical protein [Sinorhizobium]|uniref:hypothetical protein n=1 Tax=Sinorhizobium TaxID=28105 RepID=UPI000BEA2D4C|nr:MULTISPECIES: hypothetical protein [Sinorhizobium]PDT51255.1 hypothetical protein CO664_22575 [Sinorhizobium sp. NG07B]POH25908.1 hypothetical protein ATY30_26940 [Sinorhizobium americanum]